MNLQIKKLSGSAVIPTYAHSTDAGFDIYASEDVIIEPGETVKIPTGIAISVPAGFELQIRPRSGVTSKTKLRVQLGTVDAGYIGEIHVIVDNMNHLSYHMFCGIHDLKDEIFDLYGNDNSYMIKKGDRIAQGVLSPVNQATFTETDNLEESERGSNGFGSSGY